jgi:glycine/D-amino acid oxidase-like deaminating enzyme
MLSDKLHIAIVGAGFAGLATALNLLFSTQVSAKVTIYHKDILERGASGVASGLLHPFPAGATKLSFMGFKALHEAITLINTVKGLTKKRLYQEGGIIKLALNDENKKLYSQMGLTQEGLTFYSQDKVQSYLEVHNLYPGLFIHPGYTVYCKDYLAGCAEVVKQLGGEFVQEEVLSLDSLKKFDKVIVCAGSGTKKLVAQTKLQCVKGHILTMKFPYRFTTKSLIGEGYISVTQDPYIYHVGSSYEHHFKDPFPDLEIAKKKILTPWLRIFPEMQEGEILACDAGIRVMYPKNYLPLIQKIDEKNFFFTALGSRGLLYHALLAKQLVHALETGVLDSIQQEFLG